MRHSPANVRASPSFCASGTGIEIVFTLRGDALADRPLDAAPMTTTELSNLIQYRCVRPDHLRLSVEDRVFVHADGWAYCPAGRGVSDHSFIPTGGLERRRIEGGVTIRRA